MIPHVEPVEPTGPRRLIPRLMRLTGGRLAALLPFPAAVIETRNLRNDNAVADETERARLWKLGEELRPR